MKISLEYTAYGESCSVTAEAPFEMSYLNCTFGEAEDDSEDESDDEELEDGEEIVEEEESDADSDITTVKSGSGYKNTVTIGVTDVVASEGISIEYGSSGKNEKLFIDDADTLEQVGNLAALLELVL